MGTPYEQGNNYIAYSSQYTETKGTPYEQGNNEHSGKLPQSKKEKLMTTITNALTKIIHVTWSCLIAYLAYILIWIVASSVILFSCYGVMSVIYYFTN